MAEIFQIAPHRFVTARKIKGSPCILVRECYKCDDSPSGWYEHGSDSLIPAASTGDAVKKYMQRARA